MDRSGHQTATHHISVILGYLVFFNFDFSLQLQDDPIDILQVGPAAGVQAQGALDELHLAGHIVQSPALRLQQILLGALVVQSVLQCNNML